MHYALYIYVLLYIIYNIIYIICYILDFFCIVYTSPMIPPLFHAPSQHPHSACVSRVVPEPKTADWKASTSFASCRPDMPSVRWATSWWWGPGGPGGPGGPDGHRKSHGKNIGKGSLNQENDGFHGIWK